jgi:hypothetical protein
LADTRLVQTPADLEDFSSHRVLWETVQGELAKDPFSLEGDPGTYLASRMRRFDVSTGTFPQDRFLTELIVPAYQQSVVRAIIKAGLPVQLFGEGWSEIEEFKSHAAGAVHSADEQQSALAGAGILLDLWPWRAGHPINAINRSVNCREGRSLSALVQRARNALAGGATIAPAAGKPLDAQLLSDLLAISPAA